MCERHSYKWEEAEFHPAHHGRIGQGENGAWALRCAICGEIVLAETKSAGGTPWRHTFTQNMQWAARVEREMLKRRAG